jgi:hypothetical protein
VVWLKCVLLNKRAEVACFFNQFLKHLFMKKAYLSVLAAFVSALTFAQEGSGDGASLDVNVNTNDGNWYASPWVWVVGAAVFILLLVALTRGGGTRRAD